MNRTWRDAACEVAWNKASFKNSIDKENDKKYLKYFNVPAFLEGHFGVFSLNADINAKEYLGQYYKFSDFRAAFMKWLDENEVKK